MWGGLTPQVVVFCTLSVGSVLGRDSRSEATGIAKTNN
jgi:hypothetical protein